MKLVKSSLVETHYMRAVVNDGWGGDDGGGGGGSGSVEPALQVEGLALLACCSSTLSRIQSSPSVLLSQ